MGVASVAEAKARARALRAEGRAASHSAALELVAREEGARDWNTLCARLRAAEEGPPFHTGQAVSGRYLSQPFTGRILSVEESGQGWRLVLRFDVPVDTVRFASFSNFRRQVRVEVGRDGRSPQRTSDGVPQVVLDP